MLLSFISNQQMITLCYFALTFPGVPEAPAVRGAVASAAGAASEPELQSENSAEADILRPIQTVAALARRSTE